MADNDPELHARLEHLEHELEDGDITRKGYEKRRTMIMSQYLSPHQLEQLNTGLRVHNGGGDAPRPLPIGNRMSYGLSEITAGPYANSYAEDGQMDEPASGDGGVGYHGQGAASGYNDMGAPSGVQRFQEQQLGMHRDRQASYNFNSGPSSAEEPRPDSRGSQYSSRDNTMVDTDYALNPDNKPQGEQQGWSSPSGGNSRMSTMLGDSSGYFSDFTGQQMMDDRPRESYGGPQRYS
ncbi:hypothetical protein LTR12_018131, partial [Friedmanniomyces endolithicus]